MMTTTTTIIISIIVIVITFIGDMILYTARTIDMRQLLSATVPHTHTLTL